MKAAAPGTALLLLLAALPAVIGLSYVLASRPDGARWAIVIGGSCVPVTVALLRPRLAILAILTWAPFIALTRRAVYSVSPYTGFDPILLVAPGACVLMVACALIAQRTQIGAALRQSHTSRLMALLAVVFVLEIFNPLQGGLAVGVGGALFFLVPLGWFVLGRLYIDRRAARYLLAVIGGASCVAAVYGLFQLYVGLPSFDRYWLENGGYTAIRMADGRSRPFATFTSSGEYATFISCAAGLILAALLYRRGARQWWAVPVLPVIGWAILTAGSRGPVVRILAALIVLIGLRARSGMARWVVAGLVTAMLYFGAGQLMYQPGQLLDVPVVGSLLDHQAQGLSDPLGSQSTLMAKIEQLRTGLIAPVRSYPLGLGLGAPTLAAAKFGATTIGLELDFTDAFTAAGLLGGGLYVAITILLARQIVALWAAQRHWIFAAAAAMFVIVLGVGLHGNNYGLAPLWWAFMGWIDREHSSMSESARLVAASAVTPTNLIGARASRIPSHLPA